VSSKGRGSTVEPNEFYETPAWCVHRLLDRIGPRISDTDDSSHLTLLEPAIGSGAIVRAVDQWLNANGYVSEMPHWFGFDVSDVAQSCESDRVAVTVRSFLDPWSLDDKLIVRYCDFSITNPPFSLALDMARAAMQVAPVVIQLSRIGWLGSNDRADWLRANTPSVYLLPDRPSFVGKGRTDSDYYAWMVWWDEPPKFEILDSTPLEERKAEYQSTAKDERENDESGSNRK